MAVTPRKPAAKKRPKSVTLDDVRRILLALPGVAEGPCYGTPGFRVRKKFLARIWEDGVTLVVKTDFDSRDFLLNADPDTFFTTDHYRGYPSILVRLPLVREGTLRELLEDAWRRAAPKQLVASYVGQRA